MKTTCLCIFFCVIFALSHAQRSNKFIYAEIGGPGFLSVNFDARFSHKQSGFGLRSGVGFVPLIFNNGVAVPVGINYLAGNNRHFFEAEAGASFVHIYGSKTGDFLSDGASSQLIQYWYAGYRYKSSRGIIFRIGFSPLYNPLHEDGFFNNNAKSYYPWAGISIGRSF